MLGGAAGDIKEHSSLGLSRECNGVWTLEELPEIIEGRCSGTSAEKHERVYGNMQHEPRGRPPAPRFGGDPEEDYAEVCSKAQCLSKSRWSMMELAEDQAVNKAGPRDGKRDANW